MEPGQDVLASLLDASTRTWWLSDGRGAIAHGTASGAATRREHALLAVPGAGPRAEWPAVSLLRFDDRVAAEDSPAVELTPAFVLASRGETAPALTARVPALAQLESFAELPWPRWRFRGLDWQIEREYRLVEGEHSLRVRADANKYSRGRSRPGTGTGGLDAGKLVHGGRARVPAVPLGRAHDRTGAASGRERRTCGACPERS